MMIVPYIVLAAAGAMAVKATPFDEQNEQEMEDYLNSGQPLFETGAPTMSSEDFESRIMDPEYLDLKEGKLPRTALIELAAGQNKTIPPSFDAREKWPECKSIRLVRNQANCGSCWAVSVASVMSDRLCIASNQSTQTLLSATDILSCCDECTPQPCAGSNPLYAWAYLQSHGVCSGGPYNRKSVCKPYVFRPCSYSKKEKMHYGPCNYNRTSPKPMCLKKCLQDYKKSYTEDKVYGNYYKVSDDEREIQKEIMTYGPVQASMAVYDDFHKYKNGIYYHKRVSGEKLKGVHAVKIIGWGVEEVEGVNNKKFNMKYWLISNSWGADWGEDGLFRIVRGAKKFNCQIEWMVNAGHPKTQ
ncbi:unnamed protein product [Cylicocyclus nassatus]|uniref:Peptidase C1A papain C-terminal domain-containing protein n=1 Tax=Cylicocyclus nassatus TaxID=53992 RepID=A0AA36M218_CYLNA|nr:unnamed protein product [Cylicocyclus nassatus]